jgi:hypothetical protein
MEKVSAVMDKVKSHPEVVEKVKDEVKSLADALHLRRHGKKCIVSGDFIGDSCPFTALIFKHLHHPYLEQAKIKNLSLKRRQKKARWRRASMRVPLLTRLKNLMCWSKQ